MAKAPNIGIEVSEIMAAAAMLMKPSKLDEYYNDGFKGLVNFLKEAKKLAGTKKFVFGPGLQTKAMKSFQGQDGTDITNTNPPYSEWLTAAVQGISAASSIRAWAPARAKQSKSIISNVVCVNVYLTGDSWPSEIAEYQVSAYGFQSYNSSDIVLKFSLNEGGLAYYGISLKKKPSLKSPDPTLINKAFDSVLEGEGDKQIKELNVIKAKVKTKTREYFAEVIKKAVQEKILKIGNGSLPGSVEAISKIRLYGEVKDIFKAKEKFALINLKGSGTIDLKNPLKQTDPNLFQMKGSDGKYREFTKGEMRKKGMMKEFVNRELAKLDKSIYARMAKVMTEYGEIFGKALVNLVLKTNLYGKIDEHQFAFALITGAGEVDKNGNPKSAKIPVVQAKGLYTVLCGLSALNDGGKTKYKVILDEDKNEDSEAAKVFLKLMKGKIEVLSLQLKYKGNFMGQPQFGATITEDFTKILTEQYGKVCKTP